MNKKLYKRTAVLISLLVLTVGISVQTAYAQGEVSTNGAIRLYTEDTGSSSSATEPTSSSTNQPPTSDAHSIKPAGRPFPSTGEIVQYGLLSVGGIILLLALILFFYRKIQTRGGKKQ